MNTTCPLFDVVDRVSWSPRFPCVYSVVPFYYVQPPCKGKSYYRNQQRENVDFVIGYQWPVRGEHNYHTEHVIIIVYCLGTRIVSEITVNKSLSSFIELWWWLLTRIRRGDIFVIFHVPPWRSPIDNSVSCCLFVYNVLFIYNDSFKMLSNIVYLSTYCCR